MKPYIPLLLLSVAIAIYAQVKAAEKKPDYAGYLKDTADLAKVLVQGANYIQGGCTNIIITTNSVIFLGTNYTGYTEVYLDGSAINTIHPSVLRFK